jgi:hypothetical protein
LFIGWFTMVFSFLLAATLITSQNAPKQGSFYVSQNLPKECVRVNERTTFESRLPIAHKVEKILHKDGVKDQKIIVAIFANMWHESTFNPEEVSGSCVGLFQLHRKYSGRNMSVKELVNINHHMERLLSLDCYKKWKDWAIKNKHLVSCGYMAFKFATEVERCATRYRLPRLHTANKWWMEYSRRI